MSRFARFRQIGAHGLFWSWNIIFLTFLVLGFVPIIAIELFWAIREGTIPAQFLVYATVLASIPAVAILIAAMTALRKDHARLLAFGYGVEGPLMILLGIRFFVIREVVPAVALLLAVGGLGMLTLCWQLLDRKIDQRPAGYGYLRVIGLTLLLAIGLYISTWLLFYTIPLVAEVVKGIGNFITEIPYMVEEFQRGLRTGSIWQVPFFAIYAVMGSVLFVYSATLVVVLPIVVPILYTRAWGRGVQAAGVKIGPAPAYALALVVLVGTVSLFIISNRQPQQRAFALLESPPTSVAAAEALVSRQEEIRAGLLNAYLASFRYASSVGEVYHIRDTYHSAFGIPWAQTAGIQRVYEWIARPLLYEPALASVAELRGIAEPNRWRSAARPIVTEPARAAELYERFFDLPITEGEHAAVVNAVRTTWEVNRAEAAWQAVDHREIHLVQQELTIDEHGDWADVELYEVYENRTFQREEVVYYFSLPESAVITGVWLGNSAEREDRFVYQVAPRGAAQATYRNEVQRNVDPALVEQIGPRQYRLRVFPVEPRRQEWNGPSSRPTVDEAPPLHLWLTWRVFAQDGVWPMPQLAERRNVYWDGRTTRLVNGAAMDDLLTVSDRDDNASWLPQTVAAIGDTTPQLHRVDFPGNRSVLLEPLTLAALPQPAPDLTLAVVLDRSRSMAAVADQVRAAFDQLTELATDGAAIDVYLTASEFRGEGPTVVALDALDVEDILYYGGQNAAELLAQYNELRRNDAYDGIFVLTDGTGYSLGEGNVAVAASAVPVWMVHLGGLPLGYDDPTLEVIQASGGGVTDNLNDALTRFAVAIVGLPSFAEVDLTDAVPDLIDGYGWALLPTDVASAQFADATVHEPSEPFAAFAGRRVILAEMMRNHADLASLDILDELHAMAIEHSIVTPYSSMIVLINERQQKLLDELAAQEDRFAREFEDVGETPANTTNILTGVPEPEEWLLIFVAVGLLGWYLWQSRERLWARG